MFTKFGLTLDATGSIEWLCHLANAAQDFCGAGITREMSYEERYHALQQHAGVDWYTSPNHSLIEWIASGYDPREAWLCGFDGCLRSTALLANFGRAVSYEDVRDALYAAYTGFHEGRCPWLREGDFPCPVRNDNAVNSLEQWVDDVDDSDGGDE